MNSLCYSVSLRDMQMFRTYRNVGEEEQVVVTDPTAVLVGPSCGDVVPQVVQLQLQGQRGQRTGTRRKLDDEFI